MADDAKNLKNLECSSHDGENDERSSKVVKIRETRSEKQTEWDVDRQAAKRGMKRDSDECKGGDSSRKRRRKSHDDEANEEDDESRQQRRHRKLEKESRKKKHKRKSHRRDKERRRKHRSRSHSDSGSEESSTESDDYDQAAGRSKRYKSRKRYTDDDFDDRRSRKRTQLRESRTDATAGSLKDPPDYNSSFGKYGTIKASDYHKQQRSFEVWMAEVKGIPSFTGPKWELQKYFQEYMEDFNTATLPHMKYYHFEQWEMDEYKRQQQQQQENLHASIVQQDEARHRHELHEKARRQKQQELDLVRASLNPEKVQEMKQQLLLKTEMAHAFKTGDKETFARLQRRLEPDQK